MTYLPEEIPDTEVLYIFSARISFAEKLFDDGSSNSQKCLIVSFK